MSQEEVTEKSDEEIISLYKDGDEAVFKELVNRYTKPIYNFTARITNLNDAPDIVSLVFIKVWKNLNRFDEKRASFKTWIFVIARNTTTDFLRKKKNVLFSDLESSDETEDSFASNIPDESMLPPESLQRLQDKEFLNSVLDKLAVEEKEILIFHHQEDMTFDEISKVLNKSLNTIKSKYRRALIKLRKLLS